MTAGAVASQTAVAVSLESLSRPDEVAARAAKIYVLVSTSALEVASISNASKKLVATLL